MAKIRIIMNDKKRECKHPRFSRFYSIRYHQMLLTLSTGFAFAAFQLWKKTAKNDTSKQNSPAVKKMNGLRLIR